MPAQPSGGEQVHALECPPPAWRTAACAAGCDWRRLSGGEFPAFPSRWASNFANPKKDRLEFKAPLIKFISYFGFFLIMKSILPTYLKCTRLKLSSVFC